MTLAAPAYLSRHGVPQAPDELVQHRLIGVRFPATRRTMPWLSCAPVGTRRIQLEFALITDGSNAARAETVLGIGIAQAGSEGTAVLLASGDLVAASSEYAIPSIDRRAVYPSAVNRLVL